MNISFLLYPTAGVKIQEDSSFWMMLELKKRGHEVSYFESADLIWRDGASWARLTPARLHARKGYLSSLPEKKYSNLAQLDCLFIRKEPPFDTEYLYVLQLLDTIKDRVFILNDPQGIAMSNEKLFSLKFRDYTPRTLVTSSPEIAIKYIRKLRHRVVVKPLNQKGGHGILTTFFKDKNLPSFLEVVTRSGQETIMVQQFISPDRVGDKRILLLNGEPLGAFIRRPPSFDFRANLSAGGSMHKGSLSAWDKRLIEAMAPVLLSEGLFFVGIDVIGNYLTEVNVTSPAGIPEINALNHVRLERQVADFIERRR